MAVVRDRARTERSAPPQRRPAAGPRATTGPPAAAAGLLRLQRDAGNAATSALVTGWGADLGLQRKGALGSFLGDIGEAASRLMKALATTVSVPPGSRHTVTAADLATADPAAALARGNGMHVEELLPFNPGLTSPLVAGETIYIPSADELLLHAYIRRFGRLDGIERYAAEKDSDAARIVRVARKRASGERGKSYATSSTRAMTPNPKLRPGKRVETKKLGDGVEYVYSTFESWKCNIYMQDTMHEAGFETKVNKRQLYPLAGNIERYEKYFTVIGIDAAQPGSIVQLDGGATAASSHNLILVDWLTRAPAATADHPDAEKVTLRVSGAESAEAAVSIRTYTVVPSEAQNGYEILVDHKDNHWQGAVLRFLKPAKPTKPSK